MWVFLFSPHTVRPTPAPAFVRDGPCLIPYYRALSTRQAAGKLYESQIEAFRTDLCNLALESESWFTPALSSSPQTCDVLLLTTHWQLHRSNNCHLATTKCFLRQYVCVSSHDSCVVRVSTDPLFNTAAHQGQATGHPTSICTKCCRSLEINWSHTCIHAYIQQRMNFQIWTLSEQRDWNGFI